MAPSDLPNLAANLTPSLVANLPYVLRVDEALDDLLLDEMEELLRAEAEGGGPDRAAVTATETCAAAAVTRSHLHAAKA